MKISLIAAVLAAVGAAAASAAIVLLVARPAHVKTRTVAVSPPANRFGGTAPSFQVQLPRAIGTNGGQMISFGIGSLTVTVLELPVYAKPQPFHKFLASFHFSHVVRQQRLLVKGYPGELFVEQMKRSTAAVELIQAGRSIYQITVTGPTPLSASSLRQTMNAVLAGLKLHPAASTKPTANCPQAQGATTTSCVKRASAQPLLSGQERVVPLNGGKVTITNTPSTAPQPRPHHLPKAASKSRSALKS